jgi:hypothetical protein
MRKIILVITLFTSLISFSQENEKLDIMNRKHELKLGAVKLLAGGIFEITYEYIQDKNRGFGASLLVNFDKGNDYIENYSITPFYRMYFQTYEDYGAKGFFVEGFTSFFSGDYIDTYFLDDSITRGENFFDISVGIALGKKWINTSGFVFEFKVGAGRNLLGNSEFDALFKGDLSIGYRF